MQLYNKDMLVFVDESGADRRDSLRKFGYSLRGKRTMSRKLLYRGRHVSTIAALSVSGMLDYRFVDGKVDGAMFRDFVDRHLLRHLMPFNGTNPHSIVMLDNCSIHYAEDIVPLMESTGALVIFLPPYSPDLNPIEEAFSSIKSFLKANEVLLQDTVTPNVIEEVITAACANITDKDCQAWIRDSGYT